MNYQFDLGRFSRPVTTASPEAQTWFDRGLIWCYGYNHQEAVACFHRAAEADPGCAMAHWGVAYASGPNYNLPWHLMDPAMTAAALGAAYDATEAALALVDTVSAPEAALIRALPARYPARDPLDDMQPWIDDFADTMRQVQAAFPQDLEIRTVFAEALMNRTPWKMWDLAAGRPAEGADTEECEALLEACFRDQPEAWAHPGVLHLYVHLMEMSPYPERALAQGDRLRTLVPDAGHLIHMPTHIDVQCGAYQDTVFWNQRACEADDKARDHMGNLNLYTAYRIHNFHFAIYGAMFLGQFGAAMAAARALQANLPEEVLAIESPPMADFMEGYFPMDQHVLVRFGRWEEILAQPLPTDPGLYQATTAMMRYARGVALAALGRVAEAEAEQALFEAARAAVSDRRRVHNNRVSDLLAVAAAMLSGEIAYRKGAYEEAFATLRHAAHLEDTLPYDEPWGWMQPVRHALGALLFEQGRLAEAEAAFRADLGLDDSLPRSSRHPGNVWALKGLHDCLQARGDTIELPHIAQALAVAEARADVPVSAPCFCAGN